jgi:hypothetical protein
MDHPKDAVTAENWKDLAVGEVSTAAKRDGEWVYLPLILKDAAAIKGVEGGKRGLSAGYVCELVWGDGVTPDGQQFDAQQTNIKINHLAVVDRARACSKARIGDGANWGISPVTPDHNPTKETIMPLKTVTVDAIPVEVTDQGATVIATLQQLLADARSKLGTADAAHVAVIAAKDSELAKKDAEIDSLKAKVLSDADLDKRVQQRGDLIAAAAVIAKDVKTTGLSDAAIRKAVVAAKLGDAAVADKAHAYIDARFDILVEDAKKATGADRSFGFSPTASAPLPTLTPEPIRLGRTASTEELCMAADAANVHTAIGLQLRGSPTVKRARELLQGGAIGRLLSANIYSSTAGFGPEVPDPYVYLEDPQNFANLITIQGAHTLDLAFNLLGEPVASNSMVSRQYPSIALGEQKEIHRRTTYDHLLFQGATVKGVSVCIEVAGGRTPEAPFRFEIVGEKGTLNLQGGAARGGGRSPGDANPRFKPGNADIAVGFSI